MSEILTQKELAARLKCSRRSVVRLEKQDRIKRLYDKPLRYMWPHCMVTRKKPVSASHG